MIMKIAMFGGSFDPVHKDHVSLVRVMADSFELDRVHIFPAACSPFKDKTGASDIHRLEMCRLAFENDSRFIVSDFEIMRGGKSYTVNTLEFLKSQYPDAQIYLITGADAFMTLSKWYEAERIFSIAHILTVVRDDDDINALKTKAKEYSSYGASCSFIGTPVGEISSTKIREMLQNGKDASAYLPLEVYDYIKDNRLYGYEC